MRRKGGENEDLRVIESPRPNEFGDLKDVGVAYANGKSAIMLKIDFNS